MNTPLTEYVQTGSTDAFRQIVESHINSVYSQCLRKLHNVALAEDVAQTVFATLAQKAAKLPPNVVLEGWLFTTTRYCCSNAQRAAARRSAAERKAALMRKDSVSPAASDSAASSETEEILDDAIAQLRQRDRNALLLRFFAGRSLTEVGQSMGVSEDAARQRIFRAIEKLRGYFKSKGITAESATITAMLGMAVKPAGAEFAKSAASLAAAKAAARAKLSISGILSRLVLTWPKLTAGIALTAATTAVVVSAGGTQLFQSAHVATTPVLADVTPPVATRPAEQSTPVNALRTLSNAIQSDDRATILQCLCDDRIDPNAAKMGRDFFLEQAAIYHLQKAWHAKFNEVMNAPGLNFDDFPGHGTFANELADMLDFPAGMDSKIDGDTAQVRVPLPPDAFMAAGPDRIDALGHWSGAMLILKRKDGLWKFDTERTLNFVGNGARQPGNTEDTMAILAKVASELGDGLDRVAGDLENGKLTTRQRVIGAIETAARKAFRAARVDGAVFMTLPVIGG